MYNFSDVNKQLKAQPIPEFTIKSLSEFCSLVENITEVWRRTIAARQLRKKDPAPFNYGELSPWFRGVSSDKYDCEPSLFRFYEKLKAFKGVAGPEKHEIEEYLLWRFKALAPSILKESIPQNDLEWNFLMRHHGSPSRLLDWTKGSFIALYFATKDHIKLDLEENRKVCEWEDTSGCKTEDSLVWMLEPRRLNEMSGGNRNIFRENHEKILDVFFPKKEREEIDLNPIYPLPMIPNLISSRIIAHVGRFTLHSFKKKGLERFAEDAFEQDKQDDSKNAQEDRENYAAYLVKIKIPGKYQRRLFRSLRSTGISDLNFTQDFDGLVDELKLRIQLGRDDHNKRS